MVHDALVSLLGYSLAEMRIVRRSVHLLLVDDAR
jgi:hypothetical protein